MRSVVRQAFREFNRALEDLVPHMYVDAKGLVTVGIGNKIDPLRENIINLGWRWRAKRNVGSPLTPLEPAEKVAIVPAEWLQLKTQSAALAGKGRAGADPLTFVELPVSEIDKLVATQLAADEFKLKQEVFFGHFEFWPADAQLGILSMSYALGAALLGFDRFREACFLFDFAAAAEECIMQGPGLQQRNANNQRLFRNAAVVVRFEYDRNRLFFPGEALPPAGPPPPGPDDALGHDDGGGAIGSDLIGGDEGLFRPGVGSRKRWAGSRPWVWQPRPLVGRVGPGLVARLQNRRPSQ